MEFAFPSVFACMINCRSIFILTKSELALELLNARHEFLLPAIEKATIQFGGVEHHELFQE